MFWQVAAAGTSRAGGGAAGGGVSRLIVHAADDLVDVSVPGSLPGPLLPRGGGAVAGVPGDRRRRLRQCRHLSLLQGPGADSRGGRRGLGPGQRRPPACTSPAKTFRSCPSRGRAASRPFWVWTSSNARWNSKINTAHAAKPSTTASRPTAYSWTTDGGGWHRQRH